MPACYANFIHAVACLELSLSHFYWPKVNETSSEYADWETCSNKIGKFILSNQLKCLPTIAGDFISPSSLDAGPWIFDRKDYDEIIDILATFDSPVVDLRFKEKENILRHLENNNFGHCKIDPKSIVKICIENHVKIQELEDEKKLCLLDFILSENGDVEGLPLLPLLTGRWVNFMMTKSNKLMYFYTPYEDISDCVPKYFDRIIKCHSNIKSMLPKIEKYGIVSLEKYLPQVLKHSLFRGREEFSIEWNPGDESEPSLANIKSLWTYLNEMNPTEVKKYAGLNIVPSEPFDDIDSNEEYKNLKPVLYKMDPNQKIIYNIKGFEKDEDDDVVDIISHICGRKIMRHDPTVITGVNLHFCSEPLGWKNTLRILQHHHDKVQNNFLDKEESFMKFLHKAHRGSSEAMLQTEMIFLRNLKLLKDILNNRIAIEECKNSQIYYIDREVESYMPLCDVLILHDIKILHCALDFELFMAKNVFQIERLDLYKGKQEMLKIIKRNPEQEYEAIIWIIQNFPQSWYQDLHDVKFVPSDDKFFSVSEVFDHNDENARLLFGNMKNFFMRDDSPYESIQDIFSWKMKTFKDVTKQNIQSVSFAIHSCGEEVSHPRLKLLLNASKTKEFLNDLKDYNLIPTMKNPPTNYPTNMPWCSDGSLSPLKKVLSVNFAIETGAVTPIADIGYNQFLIRSHPDLDEVLAQLGVLVNNAANGTCHYNEFGRIYCMIAKIGSESGQYDKINTSLLGIGNWILTASGFKSPKEVNFSQNIYRDFSPYIQLPIREIIDEQTFYEKLGIKSDLNDADLNKLCLVIKEEHHEKFPGEDWKDSSRVLANCLQKITGFDSVELPVLKNSKIVFLPISECYFDDIFNRDHFDALQNIDDYNIVVESDIPKTLAKKMKMRPLTEVLLNLEDFGDEDFEQYGQTVDVSTRIKEILREYSEVSIYKETIQNAEDAGASVVAFYLDNNHSDKKDSLFDHRMEECQGPSLWIYNDEQFSDEDFNNLTKLGGATKKEMMDKIGSFGIGFNSVYHFTDVPQIVSGNYFVAFDPTLSYLPNNFIRNPSKPGVKINLKKGPQKLKLYKDQFAPFVVPEFGLDLGFHPDGVNFDGTVLRLPLRMRKDSNLSKMTFTERDYRLKELEGYFEEKKFKYIPFLSSVSRLKLLKNSGGGKDEQEIIKAEKVLFQSLTLPWKACISQYMTTSLDVAPLKVCIVEQTAKKNNRKEGNVCMIVLKKMADKTSNAFKMALSQEGKENGLQPCIGIALPIKREKDNFFKIDRNLTENGSLFSHLPLGKSLNNHYSKFCDI